MLISSVEIFVPDFQLKGAALIGHKFERVTHAVMTMRSSFLANRLRNHRQVLAFDWMNNVVPGIILHLHRADLKSVSCLAQSL